MEILVILIISELLLFILFFGTFIIINDKNSIMRFAIIFSNILVCIILISAFHIKEKPNALDVYRGKTALEITYKNKVPVDSTVVWKED